MIAATQSFEARMPLGWSRDRMAARCGVSADTLRGFELGRLVPRPRKLEAIKAALKGNGVEFTNGGQTVIKLRKQG